MAERVVRSELQGVVWKVQVAPGDQVRADQAVILLEVMKTEIPVATPCAGRVVRVQVAEGDLVNERQPLLVLEV